MSVQITNNLNRNLNGLISATEICIDKKLIMPALMLLYSGIDVVGALERKPNTGTKANFIRWVDSYMLKAYPIGCSGLELYGARCGILHTMAAESDLSRSGKAREITYAWGDATVEHLKKAGKIINHPNILAVHVNDLLKAFKSGLAIYFDEINKDGVRSSLVIKNAGIWLTDLPLSVVSHVLSLNNTEKD
jgi:hypothetical protein